MADKDRELIEDIERGEYKYGFTSDIDTETIRRGLDEVTSRGVQELGIVTEPGGKVYVKVRVTNASGLNEWHNDSKSAKDGTRRYKTRFNLPMDKRNTVEIEVINKGEKDTSFVVISN